MESGNSPLSPGIVLGFLRAPRQKIRHPPAIKRPEDVTMCITKFLTPHREYQEAATERITDREKKADAYLRPQHRCHGMPA